MLIHDLCLSFVKKLQAIATKYLKRWVGLPKCANPSILYIGGPIQCGLKVRNLITLRKQQQHIRLRLLESSSNGRCWLIASLVTRRQSNWTRKFTPAREAQCAKTVISVSNSAQMTAYDPTAGNNWRSASFPTDFSETGKYKYIHDIDVAEQLQYNRKLQLQGRWID